MRFFNDFVNFTGVNFDFLSRWRNCKLDPGDRNRHFAPLPRYSKLQMKSGFQSGTRRW